MSAGDIRPGVRLGVDVGDVRIGVARSDPSGLIATPVETVRRGAGDLARLRALVDEEGAVEVVIGLPRSLSGGEGPAADLTLTPETAVVMDMVYKPLRTEFLRRAEAAGRRTVDGLEMLLRQAVPTFERMYGIIPPAEVDTRGMLLRMLGEA